MNAKRKIHLTWVLMTTVVLILAPFPVGGQDSGGGDHGGGHSGGGGCGDVFGELMHILRDDRTGQPILAQRWIKMPANLLDYGWGYCPIGVYGEDKQELPFLPYSCDIDPAYVDLIEEVDYFGRLNGGRTKERNNRMHFNEVISNIKLEDVDVVTQAPEGRLMLGFDCVGVGKTPCDEWHTIDSPMESQGLYSRIMKYGHLATDPYEIDAWSHGDPKLSPQFYPALGLEDWKKFDKSLKNLIPEDIEYLEEECYDYNAAELFDDVNLNGVADEFVFRCADPQKLENADFISGAKMLAAAAPKTGLITVDLIQYFNRFVKITRKTPLSESTLNTLPALYRDCWDGIDNPADPPEEGEVDEPSYLRVEECEIVAADEFLTPNYSLFPDVQELFVDFKALESYERSNGKATVIVGNTPRMWTLRTNESLRNWVETVHGDFHETDKIKGFRDATKDYLRQIEFIHNYDPPKDLYCKYVPNYCL